MFQQKSNIERNARLGQTSEELAERNSIRRIVFYGVIGGVAGGLIAILLLPQFPVGLVFIGLLFGVGVAISIEEKMKRDDLIKRSETMNDLAKEREREVQAKIEAAKANGDFDRWKTDE